MRRKLWIAFAAVLLVGTCFLPPPRHALAVADLTSGKDDGVSVAAGSSDYTVAFETWYSPTSYTVIPSTADLGVLYNSEASSGKLCPAGMIRNTTDIVGTIRSITIDRSVADAGFYLEWKR